MKQEKEPIIYAKPCNKCIFRLQCGQIKNSWLVKVYCNDFIEEDKDHKLEKPEKK